MLWRRTSASQHIAVTNFAQSALPLVFKFVTKNFMSRGADIAFLSVCVLAHLALPCICVTSALSARSRTRYSHRFMLACFDVVVLVAVRLPLFLPTP